MPDEQVEPVKTVRCCEVTLSENRSVRGFIHDDSVFWRFVNTQGSETKLRISPEAMAAMIEIFQAVLTTEEEDQSVRVSFSPHPDLFHRNKPESSTDDSSGNNQ